LGQAREHLIAAEVGRWKLSRIRRPEEFPLLVIRAKS
jgi:hypothetical protein